MTSLQRRLLVELAVLASLTVVFLVLFPRRPMQVDVLLALLGLGLIAVNVKFTRTTVWGQFPCTIPDPDRYRGCLRIALGLTSACVALCLLGGGFLAYREGGWEGVGSRLLNWHILLAVSLYFPWALLQQFLFQFYLLGRLRTFLPPSIAIAATGIAYALVHLPDVALTVSTAAMGIVWTLLYNRYRCLSPLALSHACLGSAFYYWVYGHDLAVEWKLVAG